MRQRGIAMLFGPALACALALLPSPAARAAENAAPTLKTDVQPIFDMACADCHGVKHQRGKLNLSPATARQQLVDHPSDEVPQLMRVKPGDLEGSYLWQKLQNKAAKGKGMPRGIFTSKRLPEAQLEVIRKWIEAGAPE
jgi:mono/diheme cytochrome c family protein